MTCAADLAADAFDAADLDHKIEQTRSLRSDWSAGLLAETPGARTPGPRPGRPARPVLMAPKDVPKRSVHTEGGRAAMIHAIAHIELNAIDLALDLVARFVGAAEIGENRRTAFIDDWLRVADDEARHFQMLNGRLADFGMTYGDFPAHDGLWSAAEGTTDDIAARLAVGPMTLEARGLDVTPAMIEKFRSVGDGVTAGILEVIYEEEVSHVAAGRRWFEHICAVRDIEPHETYQSYIRNRLKGVLKSPFNEPARDAAGLFKKYYMDLTG